MASLISASVWIQRGVSQRHPKKFQFSEEESRKFLLPTRGLKSVEDDEEGWEDASVSEKDEEMNIEESQSNDVDDLSAFQLDTYDDQEDGGILSNLARHAFYDDSTVDPHLTPEDEEADREDLEILPSDNLLVFGKTQDEVSQLEIYVYDSDPETPSVYPHHDILLPAMPLCIEWLDFGSESGATGNFVAVGTLDPEIEIWCLDTVDGMYPTNILGKRLQDGLPSSLKRSKRKLHQSKNSEFHCDSVLSLSWNRSHRNLLVSASADTTLKLWDLSRPAGSSSIRSFDIHSDKVQAVQWNLTQPTVLLSGGYDRTVLAFDSRSPTDVVGTTLTSDVECIRWDVWNPSNFMVSQENGLVQYFDSRLLSSARTSNPIWTLAAHDAATSSIDISPHLSGCFVTGGTDKSVKLWSMKEQVSLIEAVGDFGVGKVFSTTFCPDDATTLAISGSNGTFQIWDAYSTINKCFDLTSFHKTEPKQSHISVSDDKD